MEDSEQMTIPSTATMLETGTPQAIALRKENVIESELKSIELNFRGLKIAGVNDLQGEKAVVDARKYCKKLRVTAERICKEGREDAIEEQKKWLAVEKYVVNRITPVEKELSDEESRIKKLREEIKLEAERKKKAEEDRLEGICREFAKAGKLMVKDEIRNMEPGAVQLMLRNVQIAKAEKEAAAQKLADEKLAAEAENEALKRQIAELQAQLLAKQAPAMPTAPAAPPAPSAPAAAPLQAPLPESRPAMRATAATLPMPPANGGAGRAMAGGMLPIPPVSGKQYQPLTAERAQASYTLPMPPAKQGNGQAAAVQPVQRPEPLFTPEGELSRPGAGKSEAELIADDKAALQNFAVQVDLLKKYVPDFASAKATGLTGLLKDQTEKFVAYITKKREEL